MLNPPRQAKAQKKAEKKAAKADAKANNPYGIHHVAASYAQQQQQYDQANAATDYAQQNVNQSAWDYQVTNGHGTAYNHLTAPPIIEDRLVKDSGYYANTYQAYQGTVNDAHSRNYQMHIATQEFVNIIDCEQQRRNGGL